MVSNWFFFQEESYRATHAPRFHHSLDDSLTICLHRYLILGKARKYNCATKDFRPMTNTPTLFERVKRESKNGNKKKKGIRICFLVHSISRVEGRVGISRWGLRKVTSGSIIHMNLYKPNNKLVSAWLEHFWCTHES
jgi:hypothetical protein